MNPKTDLSNLYDGSLVKVSVKGNRSKGTFVEDYAMVISTSFFDTETRREFQRLKKEIHRLPYRYSPPKKDYSRFLEINRLPWVSNKEIPNLVKELEEKKKYFTEDFPEKIWKEKITDPNAIITTLFEERKDLSLTNIKTNENITSPDQQSIPKVKEEFKSWFEVSWEIIPITKGDNFISSIIRNTQNHLKTISDQIQTKEDELAKKQNMAKTERDRIEADLKKLRDKKNTLDDRINKKWKDGIENKQDQYIALIDSKISNQLQEFYLLVDSALHDFSYKGKVHGRDLNKIKTKANEIREISESLGIEQLEDLSSKLSSFPDTIKQAQIKLSSESGELPDLDLFDVDFKAITSGLNTELGKESTTHLEVDGLLNISESFNELFNQKAKEPRPEKKKSKSKKAKIKPKEEPKKEPEQKTHPDTFIDVAEEIKIAEEFDSIEFKAIKGENDEK